MSEPFQPKLRDLRRDRKGRYVYIPVALRLGAFLVPPERVAPLDRSANRFSAIASFATFLLIGFVPGPLVTKFALLGIGLSVLVLGRRWMARGLEPVAISPGGLEPQSLSWASWAARMGKVRLRLGLVVGVGCALLPLPVLATSPPFTGQWISVLLWILCFAFFGYASWRGLRSLP